jgi:MerR family transcriptional regulator, copper efflux regulator
MNIGQAAKATGISAKMIRYYESVGLVSRPLRTESGYRVYERGDLDALRFIHRARDLGFSVEQMRTLMALWRDRSRASADVKSMAVEHVAALATKAEALLAMIETLQHLAEDCRGDDGPDCPIIEGFAQKAEAPLLRKRDGRFGVASLSMRAA